VLNVDIMPSILDVCEEKLDPVTVEKVDKPVCMVRRFREMSVLKDETVDCKFVFCVDKLDPVTVEKLERPT